MGVLKQSFALLVFTLAMFEISGQQSQHHLITKTKKIVTYLGTDFILRDGCPVPSCNQKNRDCRKLQLDTQAEYNKCLT